MSKRKKQQEPEPIRFVNTVAPVVPGFWITDLSEADIRLMASGKVPAWLTPTLEFLPVATWHGADPTTTSFNGSRWKHCLVVRAF